MKYSHQQHWWQQRPTSNKNISENSSFWYMYLWLGQKSNQREIKIDHLFLMPGVKNEFHAILVANVKRPDNRYQWRLSRYWWRKNHSEHNTTQHNISLKHLNNLRCVCRMHFNRTCVDTVVPKRISQEEQKRKITHYYRISKWWRIWTVPMNHFINLPEMCDN